MITVEIKGLDKMRAAFKKSPQIVSSEMNDAIKKSIMEILAASKPEIPIDTGALAGSNKTTFSQLRGELRNTSKYAPFVHGDGKKKRSKPHFPPLEQIEPWARRHGIPAIIVARSIAKKGTKLIPFYKIGVEKTESKIQNLFEKALKNITNRLSQ